MDKKYIAVGIAIIVTAAFGGAAFATSIFWTQKFTKRVFQQRMVRKGGLGNNRLNRSFGNRFYQRIPH